MFLFLQPFSLLVPRCSTFAAPQLSPLLDPSRLSTLAALAAGLNPCRSSTLAAPTLATPQPSPLFNLRRPSTLAALQSSLLFNLHCFSTLIASQSTLIAFQSSSLLKVYRLSFVSLCFSPRRSSFIHRALTLAAHCLSFTVPRILAAHCLFIMPQSLSWIPRSLCINLSCSSCLDSCRFFFDHCASTLAAHRLFFVPRRSSFVPRPSSFISHLYISASPTDASFFAGTCFPGAFPYFVASLALRRISCTPLYLLYHVASPTPFYIRPALSCIFLFLAGTIIDLSRT